MHNLGSMQLQDLMSARQGRLLGHGVITCLEACMVYESAMPVKIWSAHHVSIGHIELYFLCIANQSLNVCCATALLEYHMLFLTSAPSGLLPACYATNIHADPMCCHCMASRLRELLAYTYGMGPIAMCQKLQFAAIVHCVYDLHSTSSHRSSLLRAAQPTLVPSCLPERGCSIT